MNDVGQTIQKLLCMPWGQPRAEEPVMTVTTLERIIIVNSDGIAEITRAAIQ